MYNIPVIEGDGIGPEVIEEGKKVLDAAGEKYGFSIDWIEYPFGADYYLEKGKTLDKDAIEELSSYKAIYFGSVGDPRVDPGVLEKGILLKLRFGLDQFVNLRPLKTLDGVSSPLDKFGDIDFEVIRENTEDFYVDLGGRVQGNSRETLNLDRSMYNARFDVDIETSSEELAYQIGVASREGTKRVTEFAFQRASEKGHDLLTAVDKANVMTSIYGLWREIVDEVGKSYGLEHEYYYVDAAAMEFVRNPDRLQTVLAPNSFGDILTDLGAMLQGGLGISPGANINPEGTSTFEPLHGSAPDIAGDGIANPTATIWAGSMLLDFIGEKKASNDVMDALEKTLLDNIKTPDLGGNASTEEFGSSVVENL